MMNRTQSMAEKMRRLAELMPGDAVCESSGGRLPIEILKGLGFNLVQFWSGREVRGPWSMFWNDGQGNEIEILPCTIDGKEVVHFIGSTEGQAEWIADFTRLFVLPGYR